jgi:formylglycine-generating enzyme required for sulfatase activity
MPAEQPSSKLLPDQIDTPESSDRLEQNWHSGGKPLFSEQASAHEDTDILQAETTRKLKKNFQRVKRRKRWLKITGIFGFLIISLSGIGVGLWEKNKLFRVTMLKTVSPVVSIHIPPQMVTVPAGIFRQGNIHGEKFPSEHPLRKVTVNPFAIGKFEVTFEEYDRFAIATGRSLPKDEGWGRGRRPVINISWENAVDYADWLSQETGSRYRLPTESEWEYAARNKGEEHVWAGTSDTARLEDYAWFNSNSGGKTQPVGRKSPNGLGIYDMSGNVWEWVNDCWHDTYTDAPTDGSAWLETDGGNCDVRLKRGGGWKDSPDSLRTSFRNWYSSDTRSTLIGLRLVQELQK